MLTDDLFQKILIDPALDGDADCLRVVSGFASAGLATHHIQELIRNDVTARIELIVGMTPAQGLDEAHHLGFKRLSTKYCSQPVCFECRYVHTMPPVHSKIYCWLKNDVPEFGFIGSSNYSIHGFLRNQRETMDTSNAVALNGYFDKLKSESILCKDRSVTNTINIHNSSDMNYEKVQDFNIDNPESPPVHVSLLIDNDSRTPRKSGINWGQRDGRDRNQAYLSIRKDIQDMGFFPSTGQKFWVVADDGWEAEMVRAQQNGKAIETTRSNALLGRYLRKRIGVASGEYVERRHLVAYGRTDVEFSKITEKMYYMDFSVT